MMHDRLKLLDVHLNAAVSGNTDDTFSRTCKSRANGGGQVVTHGGGSRIRNHPLSLAEAHGLEGNNARGGVSTNDGIIIGQLGRELLDKVVGIQRWTRFALMILDDRITLHTFPAPSEPPIMSPRAIVIGVALVKKFFEKLLEIVGDGELWLNRRLMQLSRVYIDLDLEGVG